MCKKTFFLAVVFLFSCNICFSQLVAQDKNKTSIKLSVSPMQQSNYDAFMTSIRSHETLSAKSSFIQTKQSLFEAIKNNDNNRYLTLLKQFSSEYSQLSQKEKDSYQQFIRSVPNPNPTDTGLSGLPTDKPPMQACYVVCTFGSCAISCYGTPTCTCNMGYPECLCGIGYK